MGSAKAGRGVVLPLRAPKLNPKIAEDFFFLMMGESFDDGSQRVKGQTRQASVKRKVGA